MKTVSEVLRSVNNCLVKLVVIVVAAFLLWTSLYAKHVSEHPLNDEGWRQLMDMVEMLDDATLIPSLLPTIMRNRQTLKLSDSQLHRLRQWRVEHYAHMVNLMDEVIEKKVRFGVESLSVNVSADHLMSFQTDIQKLQRELLKIRLSCREIVVETFTDEQWENLEFLATDNPRLASLISQSKGVTAAHMH